MSKKDYIKFAEMFKNQRKIILDNPKDIFYTEFLRENTWYIHRTADIFADDNPRFDRDRFLKACGIV